MINISKLEIIGVGGKEIVHCSDMSYEVEGNTLKVYLTKDFLPLELTPLIDKEYTEEEKRILLKSVGELSSDEYEVLKDIFLRKGLTPPIIIKQGDING